MTYHLLSKIHSQSKKWAVSVLVSRKWFYREGTDNGPIKHMELVVLDSQGNHMYVQIPPQAAERLQHELEEGKVYKMIKFIYNESKPTFRAVESPYLIQFTRFSEAVLQPGLEENYPFCTYNLVPFEDIPRPSGPPIRFLDVIRRITVVSDVIPIQSMHQPEPSNTRTIILTDLEGQELKLVLWGNRAVEFEEEAVRARNEKEVVIAIFVGTLPKMNQGVKGLSGSSACRWYIDEDLPVINDFRNRLGTNFKPIDDNAALDGWALPARVYANPLEMALPQLLQLDPFENEEKQFMCTITVQRLNDGQCWWFFSCSTCNRTSSLHGSQYRCTNPGCTTTVTEETYCISLFTHDDKAEAEFTMFDKVGKEVVGKPLLTLLKSRNLGYSTIQKIARIPMVDRIAPPEVVRLIGHKYKLLVSIASKSFNVNSEQLSFQVVRNIETYKPQLSSSVFDHLPGTPGASASTSLTGSLGHMPTSKLSVGFLPPTALGKSPCPTGSARHALFIGTDDKTTALDQSLKEPDEADKGKHDDTAEPSSPVVEEKNDKDDQTQMTRHKRGATAGKGDGKAKKTK